MSGKENRLTSIDELLDQRYGKVGTEEREQFRREAYAYCVGKVIYEARRREKMTQAQLAEKIGTNKTYISKIENGLIEPGVGTFFRIIDALGLRCEITEVVESSM